jgi:transposase-like protein
MTKTPSQFELIPPYCPNSSCPFHFGEESKFYVKNGWTSTDRPPYKNQRFKCKFCKTQFSANTFRLDFRKKVGGLSERILHYSMNGMSNNSIARLINSSEGTVRNRLTELSRQALIFEKEN